MKPIRIAPLGLGLGVALASTGAFAIAGDSWYGTYRDDAYVRVEPVDTVRVEREPLIVYDERFEPPRRVIVEREYRVYRPREYVYGDTVVVRREPDYVARLNPQTGPSIGRGLFNNRGPNDFGG